MKPKYTSMRLLTYTRWKLNAYRKKNYLASMDKAIMLLLSQKGEKNE